MSGPRRGERKSDTESIYRYWEKADEEKERKKTNPNDQKTSSNEDKEPSSQKASIEAAIN